MPKTTSKNTLTFHFQRDIDDASRDDVLRVTSADDGWVLVKYHDKEANVKHMSFMKEAGFMSYMESLFTLMKFDTAPYKFIQVSAPCHPMVLISTNSLGNDECIQAIGNVLSSCWRIWYPFTSNTSDAMDVDEDEEEEEEPHQYHGCYCEQEC